MHYAGIGARKTPGEILEKMTGLGKNLSNMGFILRSGAAQGADTAFEKGCDMVDGKKEIYLPYRYFRRHPSELYEMTKEARAIAREHHPNWGILSNTGWDFMTRNVYQVLGFDLKTPSAFIICWTPGGKVVGGTGQALRIAKTYEIPVLNFGNMSDDEIADRIFAIERQMNDPKT